nr:replication protein A 32 kDa subunit-A isoform X1 [Salvelinus alpinus]
MCFSKVYNRGSDMGTGYRYNQSTGGFTTFQSGQKTTKRSVLQMMPCTVSQLLSATAAREVFNIGDIEVNQVSVVGIVRRTVPSVNNVLYSVDDMTGPPLGVKLWVDTADPGVDSTFVSPGTYVKVSGSLRIIQGQRSLVAVNLCCLEDLNEITSHMLEVVQAHMQHNRNPCGGGGNPGDGDASSYGLSASQSQVLNLIRSCSDSKPRGISLEELDIKLGYLSMTAISQTLEFLIREGHIFSTIDDKHFRSTTG